MGTNAPDGRGSAGRLRRLALHGSLLRRRAGRWPASVRGMVWATVAGVLFVLLNALMRQLTLQIDPFQTQFLRYLMGLALLVPLMARSGLAAWRPRHVGGQFLRGGLHAGALFLWFTAIPHISIADTTAIGFTGPIFIMLGAALFFREPMRWERWAGAAVGFAGVLIVVAPKLTGSGGWYSLVMLASAPVFAASFLVTKALTRYESPKVIVAWQSLTVTLFSLPLALLHWTWPSPLQWLLFVVCGLLGSLAHWCLTHSYAVADISATQSVKFLELVWATLLGWALFGDAPSSSTLLGGVVIFAATLWVARREARPRSTVV